MLDFMSLIVLACVLFASTNVDDLFILLGFFADPKFRPRQVMCGQIIGIAAIFFVSVIAALSAMVIPHAYIGLLGFAPIVIGARKLLEVWCGTDESEAELESHERAGSNTMAFSAIR
jgi:cadmium resistance protein CadD (predicted permease)